jgi:hypothetical protein
MNCQTCQSALPDLLLDAENPWLAPTIKAARAHIATCTACAAELHSLEAAFSVLDSWTAPEVSPYFDQKFAVLLREEQARPPAGWLEQLRSRLLFNTGRQFRPAMAGVMAAILIVGGGSVGLSNHTHPVKIEASAAVQELQILDRNEQALQEMDQLLQDDAPTDDAPAAPPAS